MDLFSETRKIFNDTLFNRFNYLKIIIFLPTLLPIQLQINPEKDPEVF